MFRTIGVYTGFYHLLGRNYPLLDGFYAQNGRINRQKGSINQGDQERRECYIPGIMKGESGIYPGIA